MKSKAYKKKSAEDLKNGEDLKLYTKDILEQKQLENSALRKILEFLENENNQIKSKKITDNSSNNKQIKG